MSLPGAKGLVAGGRENGDAQRRIIAVKIERGVKFAMRRRIERIHDVWRSIAIQSSAILARDFECARKDCILALLNRWCGRR